MDTHDQESTEQEQGFVIEATLENFEQEVVERSRTTPVILDFWANWCGPCKTLGPVLETLAEEYNGRFVLVKADTETVPELAEAFGVQSIPAVFGLRDGRVVDRFVGALPEPALRSWIDGLLPSAVQEKIAAARRLEATDLATAEARYRDALALDKGDHDARAGLARVLVRQNRFDEARELIADLEGQGYFDDEVEAVKAELELKAQAEGVGGVDAAREALAGNPEDPAARMALAEALAGAGSFEEALKTCLALVEEGRKDFIEPARLAMVKVFQILPADSELANDYRRRLSAALF